MTQEKSVNQKAAEPETSQPVAGFTPRQKGDYTKYFYRNIEHLWTAVEQLQGEVTKLEDERRRLIQLLSGVQ